MIHEFEVNEGYIPPEHFAPIESDELHALLDRRANFNDLMEADWGGGNIAFVTSAVRHSLNPDPRISRLTRLVEEGDEDQKPNVSDQLPDVATDITTKTSWAFRAQCAVDYLEGCHDQLTRADVIVPVDGPTAPEYQLDFRWPEDGALIVDHENIAHSVTHEGNEFPFPDSVTSEEAGVYVVRKSFLVVGGTADRAPVLAAPRELRSEAPITPTI